MFAIIHVLLFYTGNPSIYFAFMTYTISLLVDLLFPDTRKRGGGMRRLLKQLGIRR